MTTRVLHLQSSALGEVSVTRALGAAVLETLGPATSVHTHDLAADPLPHWSPGWAQSPEAGAWVDELVASDVLVLEVPMYNFGIPSVLKAWIDTVAMAGRTFHYTAEGPVGHLTALRVVLVSGRGGAYGDAHAADFQERYLRQVLGFLGVTAERIEVIRAEGLALGEAARTAAVTQAHQSMAAILGGTSAQLAVTH